MTKVKRENYFNTENSHNNYTINRECSKLHRVAVDDVDFIKQVKKDIRLNKYLYDCVKDDLHALQNNQISPQKKRRTTPEILSLVERLKYLGSILNANQQYLLDVRKSVAI